MLDEIWNVNRGVRTFQNFLLFHSFETLFCFLLRGVLQYRRVLFFFNI